MDMVDSTSKNDLTPEWLALFQRDFCSARITDEEMCTATRTVLADCDYVTDPHTAVAFAAALKFGYYCGAGNNYDNDPKSQIVALLSTASPCKFQKAVTEAVGEKGWNDYFESGFPVRAKAIMTRKEIPPIVYQAKRGGSLEESQADWEVQARSILADFRKAAQTDKS